MPSRDEVRRTFDRIAGHFSATREHPWPEVESFVADAAVGDAAAALDLGCGNGRHAQLLADRADRVVCLDASRELLGEARARSHDRGFAADLVQGDAARLPLRDDAVALAVYVATLHHLPTEAARRASLDDLARVLAPGATALVSAWSTEADRFSRSEGFDTALDWTLPDGTVVERFYHVYAPDEFRATLDATALRVRDCRVSSGNCYAIVEPPS